MVHGAFKGIIHTIRMVWQTQAFCCLHLNVPEAQAVAWLKTLPDNVETFARKSNMMGTHDLGAMMQDLEEEGEATLL